MQVVGHGGLLSRLMGVLPSVSLFVGPSSVGKWTAAEYLRGVHEVSSADVLRVRRLTAEDARAIVRFASKAAHGTIRLVIVRLDGASPATLSALLKSLEEAPSSTRFILTATELPPATIVSRATVFRFPLLSDEQVEDVLLLRKFKPTEAKRYAALAGGQVRRALDLVEGMDAKVTVLAAVRALRERDAEALDNLAGKWEDQHTGLLATLCRELLTSRWRIFSNAEVEGLGKKTALAILTALRPDIRPRLVVRASLASVLRGAA